MISLQQLLGKEDVFYSHFEGSAEVCCESVQALRAFLPTPAQNVSLERLAHARRKDKAIHNQIVEDLCTNVVTALEREDIMALADTLYKIPKAVEKIGERMVMAPQFMEGIDWAGQVSLLEKATQILLSMVRSLRAKAPPAKIKALNEELQQVEGEADDKVRELLKDLYTGSMEGRRVVFLKDLFELMEKVTDRCRDAGNVIVQITLKGE